MDKLRVNKKNALGDMSEVAGASFIKTGT